MCAKSIRDIYKTNYTHDGRDTYIPRFINYILCIQGRWKTTGARKQQRKQMQENKYTSKSKRTTQAGAKIQQQHAQQQRRLQSRHEHSSCKRSRHQLWIKSLLKQGKLSVLSWLMRSEHKAQTRTTITSLGYRARNARHNDKTGRLGRVRPA